MQAKVGVFFACIKAACTCFIGDEWRPSHGVSRLIGEGSCVNIY